MRPQAPSHCPYPFSDAGFINWDLLALGSLPANPPHERPTLILRTVIIAYIMIRRVPCFPVPICDPSRSLLA